MGRADIGSWLSACYDDAEQAAREADELGLGWYGVASQEPKWRLADIAAKRAIVQDCLEATRASGATWLLADRTLRHLAAEFAGWPGYDEAWRP